MALLGERLISEALAERWKVFPKGRLTIQRLDLR
jgi:hypothetical protein